MYKLRLPSDPSRQDSPKLLTSIPAKCLVSSGLQDHLQVSSPRICARGCPAKSSVAPRGPHSHIPPLTSDLPFMSGVGKFCCSAHPSPPPLAAELCFALHAPRPTCAVSRSECSNSNFGMQ